MVPDTFSLPDAEGLDMLEKVNAGFRAMDVMVNDLLHFTSDRDPQMVEFPLRKLVADIEASLAPQLAAQKIHFEIKIPAQQTLRADREMLRRAVLNLVLNALDAMSAGGTLTVGSTAIDGGLELYVADSGHGLPAEVLPRVFEPFFTTKQTGTGLGLAIVSRIAEAHGGTAAASNARSVAGQCLRCDFPNVGWTSESVRIRVGRTRRSILQPLRIASPRRPPDVRFSLRNFSDRPRTGR